MAFGIEKFGDHGPSDLNSIDWNNEDHQRCVAASLVQGVYTLERERLAQHRRNSQTSLASPWWESFHFKLIRQLADDSDGSIFGGVFEYKWSFAQSPRYVIAFRGTVINSPAIFKDFQLNTRTVLNGLHQTSRFRISMQAVKDVVASVGDSNIHHVWLAGHSLGAAIALLVGKFMAKEGTFLKAFLFNPPFISLSIIGKIIENKNLENVLRFASRVIEAGSAAVDALTDNKADISGWTPRLFVNHVDLICSEYISYFKEKKNSAKDASQNLMEALRDVVLKGGNPKRQLHWLSSAKLIVSLNPPANCVLKAHGLKQWWRAGLKLESYETNKCHTIDDFIVSSVVTGYWLVHIFSTCSNGRL